MTESEVNLIIGLLGGGGIIGGIVSIYSIYKKFILRSKKQEQDGDESSREFLMELLKTEREEARKNNDIYHENLNFVEGRLKECSELLDREREKREKERRAMLRMGHLAETMKDTLQEKVAENIQLKGKINEYESRSRTGS